MYWDFIKRWREGSWVDEERLKLSRRDSPGIPVCPEEE
jgi:hypothetical protein